MRLDTERQNKLEPERITFALKCLSSVGLEPLEVNKNRIEFKFNGHLVLFYPYSGWHTGKSIKDGRGLSNLLKQLKK